MKGKCKEYIEMIKRTLNGVERYLCVFNDDTIKEIVSVQGKVIEIKFHTKNNDTYTLLFWIDNGKLCISNGNQNEDLYEYWLNTHVITGDELNYIRTEKTERQGKINEKRR